MKHITLMSLIAVAALNGSTIDEAFKTGKVSGQIRAAYINQDNAVDTDTYGTSLGGILKYETASWNDIKLGVAGYASEKIHAATGSADNGKENGDLFGSNAASYAYLGEAYADYSVNNFALRIGRQLIDTPFAQTDDIRMHPNSFEAAIATYSGVEGTTFIGGFVKRWAGYDSQTTTLSKDKFKRLGGGESNGAAVIGIANEGIENLVVQGWYYDVDKIADIYYADTTYSIPFNESVGLEVMGQYALFNENFDASGAGSGTEGKVYGIGANVNVGMVKLGAFYNDSTNKSGKSSSNGFGGGPYFTSTEEMTLSGYEDTKAYKLSADLDMSDAGIEGLKFCVQYGSFKSTPADMRVKESDFIVTYAMSEAFTAQVSYAQLEDKNKNKNDDGTGTLYNGGYDRFLVRLNYNF